MKSGIENYAIKVEKSRSLMTKGKCFAMTNFWYYNFSKFLIEY